MKIKIAIITIIIFSQNIFSQGSLKNYVKNLVVKESAPKELTDQLDNSLNVNNVYRVRLVTRGTGTDTGAEYLVWSNDSIWHIRAVNMKGNYSNHPLLTINNNIITVKTNHANNYTIRAFVEELVSEEGDAIANIFGSSYQWQRKTNDLFYTDGNVGIGTTNPSAKLDVRGNVKIGGLMELEKNIGSPNAGAIRFGDHTNWKFHFKRHIGTDAGKELMTIVSGSGNVGIGTTNPNSKLSVNGKIHTKEVKVDLVGWSDFVFYENYKLPTLKEVENHIKEKGHLKDIPSAKEVEKNGILLGEMNAKLLQKIEELTLYTIKQNKELKKQNSKIDKLENEVLKSLLERVSKLEKEIKNKN